MTNLLFTNDLKTALTELAVIEQELSKLSVKKDELREKLEKWMNINSLDNYETFDSNEKNYFRLTISRSSRRSVNIDLLQAKVDNEMFKSLVSITETKSFKCQIVKSRKKLNNTPSAPSEQF